MIQIAIIEDNGSIRNVMKDFFTGEPGYEVLLACDSFEAFYRRWQDKPLDIVLCDIGLPGKSGIEAVWIIKDHSPRTQVMMLRYLRKRKKYSNRSVQVLPDIC